MTVKLLTEHHLEFLSLKGGCTGSSESTLAKMPHFWKSHGSIICYRGPDWDTEVDGKSCTVKELLIELYEKVRIFF